MEDSARSAGHLTRVLDSTPPVPLSTLMYSEEKVPVEKKGAMDKLLVLWVARWLPSFSLARSCGVPTNGVVPRSIKTATIVSTIYITTILCRNQARNKSVEGQAVTWNSWTSDIRQPDNASFVSWCILNLKKRRDFSVLRLGFYDMANSQRSHAG